MRKLTKLALSMTAAAIASISVATAAPIVLPHVYGGLTNLGSSYANKNFTPDSRPIANNYMVGGGLELNIPFGDFGVQTGINYFYNNIGYKNSGSGTVPIVGTPTSYVHNYTSTYSSVDIPVMLTLKYNKFNFELGPYLSIPVGKLNGRNYGSDTIGNSTTTYDQSDEYELKPGVNFGLVFGGGYEERMGLGRLLIGARYMLDFTPVSVRTYTTDSNGNKQAVDTAQFTRRGLLLDVGFKVPLSF